MTILIKLLFLTKIAYRQKFSNALTLISPSLIVVSHYDIRNRKRSALNRDILGKEVRTICPI